MKVVEETFPQLLQKVLCLWRKQIFVYIDKDFAINSIRPKVLSLLLTGKIRMSQCQNSSKFLSDSYLMKTADVIMIFFFFTLIMIFFSSHNTNDHT